MGKPENSDQNKERFKALLAEAEMKWGRWGVMTKMATAMDALPASVSAWKKKGFTGSVLQLDALSKALAPEEKYPAPKFQGIILDEKREANLQKLLEKMKFALAPIIMFARAGEEAFPEDMGHAAARIAVPCDDPNCYVVDVVGDSMMPIYKEGDLLVIAPSLTPRSRDRVVVRKQDGEVLFKELRILPGKNADWQLVSLNPNHAPIFLPKQEIARAHVVYCVIKPERGTVRAMTVEAG